MAWGAAVALVPAMAGCEASATFEVRVVADHEIEILSEGTGFADVIDLARSGAHLWVLDAAPPFLARIHLETGETVRFGDEGAGPGEMVWPVAIVPVGNDHQLTVWDPAARRVHRFGSDGRHLASSSLSRGWAVATRRDIRHVTHADPFRIRRDRNGFFTALYPSGVNRGRDLNLGMIGRAAEPEFEEMSVLGPLSRFAVQDGDAFRELGPLPLWDYCDGRLAVWNPGERAVEWFDGLMEDGSSTSVSLAGARRRLSRAAKLEHLAAMARLELGPTHGQQDLDLEKRLAELEEVFATWAPEVLDIRCGTGGAVWLRIRSDPESRNPERWRRVQTSGASTDFEFPAHFRPLFFGEIGAVGVLKLPEGDALGIWRSASASVDPAFNPEREE